MITKELIGSFIEEKLSEDGVFLVELKVSPANKIYVEIDSFDGVGIGYCVTISKMIEGELDREEQDFELEVSTSSISAPFKILNHYKKNLGIEVEILTIENKKLNGTMIEVNDDNFVLETETMQKVEGKKKKQLMVEATTFAYDDVRSTKLVIKFK
jgi:ribosome maturation factor RimP